MNLRIFCTLAIAFSNVLLVVPSASADQVFNDDVIVDAELLCVGTDCGDGEPEIPDREGLKLKGRNIALRFVDQSTGFVPDRDWQLNINETTAGGREALYITDLSSGQSPFWIEGDAPENAFFLSSAGRLGLGTMLPLSDLHIASNTPTIIFEDVQGVPQEWAVSADASGFEIINRKHDRYPFTINVSAPDASFEIEADGDIGLGTFNPLGKLHTNGDGVQLVYFESGDGGPVQVRFRTDSENRRFLAVDNDNNVKSQIIFLDDRINFTGQTDSGANLWLSIGPNGIVSQGPTCNPGPCDRTFDRDFFTVPAIAERAALMWENQHLPGIGPTQPHAPINLTEKIGGVIHELEVAHIYIEQLHAEMQDMQRRHQAELEALSAKNARQIAKIMARLDAME